MITQKRANELLRYDPDSGYLFWRAIPRRGIRGGNRAGGISHGYITVGIGGRRYPTHRIIWLMHYGRFPEQIDHIDHDRSNNKLENLRSVTNAENQRNRTISRKNTSGITGVYWHKLAAKWVAQIAFKGKVIYLGIFTDIGDAIKARKMAEKKYQYHPNHGMIA